MDEALQKLASVLGQEQTAVLGQKRGLRSRTPPSTLARTGELENEDSFMRRQKKHIENSKELLKRELQGTPVPIRTPSRWMMLETIQDDIKSYRPPSKENHHFRQTVDDGRRRFSSEPLSQLEKLSISELSVPQRHEGKYLFCRVISGIKQMVSCMFVVDDPSGGCIAVGVYHFVTNPSLCGASLDSQLPIGTKIAIREPYVKSSGDGGGPFVRVDSPTDIVVFEDDDPQCKGITWSHDGGLRRNPANKSAEDYKALGNAAFQRKDYYSALAAYQHALQAQGAQRVHGALYSNISATYLHLSKPGRAYLSARAALAANLDEPNLVAKALFRQASAAYQLRCFNEAELLFKHGLTVAGSHAKARVLAKEFDECLARTSQRLQERNLGLYELEVMFSDVVAGGPPARIDVADFVGPVEIRLSHSGSRGLYATRDVAVGELLFVIKAISIASKTEPEIENVSLMAFNLVNNRLRDVTQSLNTTRLIHLCTDNPAFYSTICHLYDGNLPASPSQPPLGIVDTEKQVLDQLGIVVNVDVGRLERVVAFNSFGDSPFELYIDSSHPTEAGNSAKLLKENKDISLFYLSSFCNHSCVPNARRTLFGDVMVVRTLLPLSRGDEITLGYVWPGVSVEEREETLERNFGFRCDCWYCREEKIDGEGARKMRKKLVDVELPKALALVQQAVGNAQNGNYDAGLYSAAFKAMEGLRSKLEATYHPDRGPLRPEMSNVWRGLSALYSAKETRKAIESEKRALVASGAVITDDALIKKRKGSNSKPTLMLSRPPLSLTDGIIHCILTIAAWHNRLGEVALQRNWVATAIWAHDMLIGGGLPVLKKRCPEYLEYIL